MRYTNTDSGLSLLVDAHGFLDSIEQLLWGERFDQVQVRLPARPCLTVRPSSPTGQQEHRHARSALCT